MNALSELEEAGGVPRLRNARDTRPITALLTGLLLGVLSGSGCGPSKPAPLSRSPGETSGSPASAAELASVTDKYGWTIGNSIQRSKLSDYKGKVVVLDFYATWCEPCRVETPYLVQLQRRYGDQGFQVIGLNVGGVDDRDQVPAYAKEFGIQYPLAFPEHELADAYLSDDRTIPQAFVFNREGNLMQRFVGYSFESGQELERLIQTSLAPKATGGVSINSEDKK